MNDPHVETLHYTIKHGDHVDYSRAAPLELEKTGFAARIADGRGLVTMISHFASVNEARSTVEPFLRAWELDMALRYGPNSLEFVYERPVIIDRKPSAGARVLSAEAACFAAAFCDVKMCVGFAIFPLPTSELRRDDIVELMYGRYALYGEGRTLLGDAANFCFTAIAMGGGGKRNAAAKHYGVSEEVLATLGKLSATKGGPHARKATAATDDFTPSERQWLEEAMKLLIRRAGEIAFDAAAARPQITMAALPSLRDGKRAARA